MQNIDKHLAISPFPSDEDQTTIVQFKDLKKSDPYPKNGERMNQYSQHSVWVRTGFPTRVRWLIKYCVDPDTLFNTELFTSFSDIGMVLERDVFQEKDCVLIAYLWGSYAYQKIFDYQHLTEVLAAHSDLQGLSVVVKEANMRLNPGEKIPRDEQVKVAAIYGDKKKARQTLTKVSRIYNSKNPTQKKKRPESTAFRVVQVKANYLPPLPLKRINLFPRIRDSQRSFLERQVQVPLVGVLQMHSLQLLGDTANPVRLTLLQIMMNLKQKDDYDRSVFNQIHKKGSDYYGICEPSNVEQANAVATFLPVIIEKKWGEQIWNWYTSEHRSDMAKYQFDNETQKIV